MVAPSRKYHWYFPSSSKGLWLITVIFFLFVASCYHSLIFYQPDKAGCAMSYMYQSYAKLQSFDTKHTRLASRYSLYLYRDAKYDPVPDSNFKPDGTPVIFIPGNAGSYRQVRSIASLAAEISASPDNNNTRLDFYTMDFQEDFSAFHGRTLLDQAEYVNDAINYILQLYDKESPDIPHPKSVIVIGHSMGGFIARSLVVLDNYVPESINTIVTLATPHLLPPLTFDSYMTDIYTRVNNYWTQSFSKSNIDRNPLSSVALISIAGGKNDNMIHSDSTAVFPIAASSNSFATLSSSIPGVWTSIDHLAIVWCHQCRTALVNALFEIIDTQSHSKTRSLEARMSIFAKHLLSGFEPYQYNRLQTGLKPSDEIVIKADKVSCYISPIPKLNHYSPFKRLYLTPIKFSGDQSFSHIYDDPASKLSYYLCKFPTSKYINDKVVMPVLDISTKDSDEIYYTCSKIDPAYSIPIPYSKPDTSESFDSGFVPNIGLKSARYYLFNNSRDLSNYEYIAAVAPESGLPEKSLVKINSEFKSANVEIDASNFALLFRGAKVRLKPMEFVDISLKKATSGLISYKTYIDSRKECEASSDLSFFMRQYVTNPFESKWYVNIGSSKPLYLSFHGVASPFTPYESNSNLHLQVFSPMFEENKEKCGSVTIHISVNVWGSLANFVIRYRTLLVPFSISIVSSVIMIQLFYYFNTSQFVSISSGLKFLISKFTIVIPCLIAIHFVCSFELMRRVIRLVILYPFLLLTRSKSTSYLDPYQQNDMFIGQSQFEMLFVGPLAYIVSIGFVSLVHNLVFYPISKLSKFCATRSQKYSNVGAETANPNTLDLSLILPTTVIFVLTLTILPNTIGLFAGLIYILVYYGKASYYFYLKVGTHVPNDSQKEKPKDLPDISIPIASLHLIESLALFLLLSIVPIGVPIFVAWIHQGIENSFFITFSSHHNALYLVPMLFAIFCVKKLTNAIKTVSLDKQVTPKTRLLNASHVYPGLFVLGYTSIFALLFGFLYTYALQTFALLFSVCVFCMVCLK